MQYQNEELQKLRSTLSDEQKRLNELNREQGASSWFTKIPLSEESYDLAKWFNSIKYHPIVNLAITLMSRIPFVAKKGALFLCVTTTSKILHQYC